MRVWYPTYSKKYIRLRNLFSISSKKEIKLKVKKERKTEFIIETKSRRSRKQGRKEILSCVVVGVVTGMFYLVQGLVIEGGPVVAAPGIKVIASIITPSHPHPRHSETDSTHKPPFCHCCCCWMNSASHVGSSSVVSELLRVRANRNEVLFPADGGRPSSPGSLFKRREDAPSRCSVRLS